MSQSLVGKFSEEAPKGFGDHYDGRLRAEDNPEFIQQYLKLLQSNDRVMHMDIHTDRAGVNFMASKAHMDLMVGAGYEYLLLEMPSSVNEAIIEFENDQITEDILRERLIDAMIDINTSSGNPNDAGLRSRVERIGVPTINAIVNAQDAGIKVRCFDSANYLREGVAKEAPKNEHIDNPDLRRDDEWDPYIEAMIADNKAVMNVGALHVGSSYGIDEYMEGRGYEVATFRIKNEQHTPRYIPHDTYNEPEFLDSYFEKQLSKDADGYDPSDFTPDLFYNEQTKQLLDPDTPRMMKPLTPDIVPNVSKPMELMGASPDVDPSKNMPSPPKSLPAIDGVIKPIEAPDSTLQLPYKY